MPVRKRSSSTVEIKSIEPDRIHRAVRDYSDWLFTHFPELKSVIWFGSWITGIPTPGSDVDLLLVLESADRPFRDRIARYLPPGFPVGIDIFPYTEEELTRLEAGRPQWYRTVMSGRRFEPDSVRRRPQYPNRRQ